MVIIFLQMTPRKRIENFLEPFVKKAPKELSPPELKVNFQILCRYIVNNNHIAVAKSKNYSYDCIIISTYLKNLFGYSEARFLIVAIDHLFVYLLELSQVTLGNKNQCPPFYIK